MRKLKILCSYSRAACMRLLCFCLDLFMLESMFTYLCQKHVYLDALVALSGDDIQPLPYNTETEAGHFIKSLAPGRYGKNFKKS